MKRMPLENYNFKRHIDEDILNSWNYFMSFMIEKDWKKRRMDIEKMITYEFRSTLPFSEPLTEGTLLAIKSDIIGWYLYLIDVYINEPHKYEYYQGARVVPIFKRIGLDLNLFKNITGIEKRIKELIRKRKSEADALLFELLVALLWAKNGYNVAFLEEKKEGKTPDLVAIKNSEIWHIECKRQSKTADYTYRETAKRQKMLTYIGEELLKKNLLLDIVFHVEIESLSDTYLKKLFELEKERTFSGKTISNNEVTIIFSSVNILEINRHLQLYSVKYPSPMLNKLIGRKSIDYKSFSCAILGDFFRVGEGSVNNLYVNTISHAFGVFWKCDAREAIFAKARDIKNQIFSAIEQFKSDEYDYKSVVHIGMETYDGPEVEVQRFEKIQNTTRNIESKNINLSWIFCHFFQSYSIPEEYWIIDETVRSLTPFTDIFPPIQNRMLIVPEDQRSEDDKPHWEKPLS